MKHQTIKFLLVQRKMKRKKSATTTAAAVAGGGGRRYQQHKRRRLNEGEVKHNTHAQLLARPPKRYSQIQWARKCEINNEITTIECTCTTDVAYKNSNYRLVSIPHVHLCVVFGIFTLYVCVMCRWCSCSQRKKQQ